MTAYDLAPPQSAETIAGERTMSEPTVMFCSQGCCRGCHLCWGMGIGCHQEPCRCEFPCTCRYAVEETDPQWRDGCVRHDESADTRSDEFEPDALDVSLYPDPCPECGTYGACGYDDEGRPMLHITKDDTDV